MKALTCEMCGSTNLIKEDGVFVCQSCGTKYSVEEARKMMVEGVVDVKGVVKVDISDELKNLYEIARRAKDTDNAENATKYYDQILTKDPSSWEANFYVVYFKAMSCKIGEIWSAANSISNCLDTVVKLVKENVNSENVIYTISEIKVRLSVIANLLNNAAKNHYDGIDASIKLNYVQEYVNNAAASADIMYEFGNCIERHLNDAGPMVIAASSWADGIAIHNTYLPYLENKESNKDVMREYANKIKVHDPSYNLPEFNTSTGGCYVATAIYGSYDCPEVWTLRRFRDFTLAESWYGRAFIKIYYAISPTLVRRFGKTLWFKNLFQKPLDNLVNRLQKKGVENTPYDDRVW